MRFLSKPAGTSPDLDSVAAAAEALNIREIKLFRVAYAWWYGRQPSEQDIEPSFMQFLFTQRAPAWVRQFTREVLMLTKEGRLDPRRYGLPPLPQPSRRIRRAESALRALYFAAWAVIVALFAFSAFR